MVLGYIADCVIAIMAVLAGFISWKEYGSHKQKENNKLLSQLNKRYLSSDEIQKVVRFLRIIDASDEIPTPYETELFFRFFEELGVYMRKGDLPKDDVKTFFGFYLEQMYCTERGELLRERITHCDEDLYYLKICRNSLNI